MGPYRERCPHPETFLPYLSGSPVKKLPPLPRPPAEQYVSPVQFSGNILQYEHSDLEKRQNIPT
jgi:hypothetical protein